MPPAGQAIVARVAVADATCIPSGQSTAESSTVLALQVAHGLLYLLSLPH